MVGPAIRVPRSADWRSSATSTGWGTVPVHAARDPERAQQPPLLEGPRVAGSRKPRRPARVDGSRWCRHCGGGRHEHRPDPRRSTWAGGHPLAAMRRRDADDRGARPVACAIRRRDADRRGVRHRSPCGAAADRQPRTRIPRVAFDDSTENRERLERTLPNERYDSSDSRLNDEPAQPIERNDPLQPIDRQEPLLPIDSTDPADPMDSSESRDAMDQRELGTAPR